MTSLRKTLKNVFRRVKGLSSSMVIGPSELLAKDFDIIIVDEAHRLRRRKNLTNYASFDTNNKILGLKEGTELDWVLLRSKKCILFYDRFQSIKPSDVRKEQFDSLFNNRSTVSLALKSQLRVKGGTDYIQFVTDLLSGTPPAKPFKSSNYELELFDSISAMVKRIQIKEKRYGLSRLIAGFSWDWISQAGADFDIELEGTKLKWNNTTEDWINSAGSSTEVGCIHTTQGYDLNYAGIIIGPELSYDLNSNELVVKKELYKDKKGKAGITDGEELKEYILNIYKTLLCRAIRGTYVYICDPALKKYLSQFLNPNGFRG